MNNNNRSYSFLKMFHILWLSFSRPASRKERQKRNDIISMHVYVCYRILHKRAILSSRSICVFRSLQMFAIAHFSHLLNEIAHSCLRPIDDHHSVLLFLIHDYYYYCILLIIIYTWMYNFVFFSFTFWNIRTMRQLSLRIFCARKKIHHFIWTNYYLYFFLFRQFQTFFFGAKESPHEKQKQ